MTTMSELLLYPLDEFADFMREHARTLGVPLAKLVRDAAERQLSKGTPLPAIGMKYRHLELARVSVLRVRAPASLLARIEADAESQGSKLQHWIETAVVLHCLQSYREGIELHEAAARACRDLRAVVAEQFGSFEHKGGWPGMYESLNARATA